MITERGLVRFVSAGGLILALGGMNDVVHDLNVPAMRYSLGVLWALGKKMMTCFPDHLANRPHNTRSKGKLADRRWEWSTGVQEPLLMVRSKA